MTSGYRIRRLAARAISRTRTRLATAIVLVPLLALTFASAAPAGAIPTPANAAFKYSVRPGDSLWKIAQRFDTTVSALIDANRLKDPDLIHPGEVLWVPGKQVQKAAVRAVTTKHVFPLKNYRYRVGEHWGGFQGAADLFAPEGTPIYAVMGGRVVSSGWTDMGGWNMMVDGDDGLMYYYAHFRERSKFHAGEFVATGEQIARVGNTGNSSGPHLHIAVGPEISRTGNAQGLRAGYGINFDVSSFLNKIR